MHGVLTGINFKTHVIAFLDGYKGLDDNPQSATPASGLIMLHDVSHRSGRDND
ncbi:MAG: hypothetical protein DHS20C01_22810 [marine bacterium B5-7]|nr:MAG: hypothetical protein DHS20C01_22810 [marine bacterium B5-7]